MPIYHATINGDGTAVLLSSAGTRVDIASAGLEQARHEVVRHVARNAGFEGEPQHLTVVDSGGTWPMLVHADGLVDEAEPSDWEPTTITPEGRDAVDQAPAPASALEEAPAPPAITEPRARQSWPATAMPPEEPPVPQAGFDTPAVRGRERMSFITAAQNDAPAEDGVRGLLGKVGLRLPPSAAERSVREDTSAVSQHWPGPRTIAVVNGKGGAGKALEVNEPVLTPHGYRPIGSLTVGDDVYGTDGLAHKVLGVYPQGERELFRVTLTDGTHVLADGDHLWEVETASGPQVLSTGDLLGGGLFTDEGDTRYRISATEAVSVIDGYDVAERADALRAAVETTRQGGNPGRALIEVSHADTAARVKFVAETLGCVVTTDQDTDEYGRWVLRLDVPASLDLSEQGVPSRGDGQRVPYRAIDSIEPAGRGQAVCISVDSADHLFLTRGCVPTHNTPVTILTSAVFARYGGSGVLAWDNNQTRGTLGWRTDQGPHDRALTDMLPHVQELLSSQAQIGDVARFVHHQPADRFDVLRSKPSDIASDQRIRPEDVRALHSVAAKYYRFIVMDSGNDESDPMWKTMIDLTDQVVVASSSRDEHAEAGALLLDELAGLGGRYRKLAEDAVVVISQADKDATRRDVQAKVEGFRPLVRDVVTIPYDPAMVKGHLLFDALRPATQRAWLAAGAAIARGL